MQTDTTRLIRADTLTVALLATAMTVALAWPVLQHPSTLVFGAESVGRHHDPFTFMRQLVEPQPLGVYSQPLTDVPASWLAAVIGPVAAYNVLVLVTFPLAAAAAFLLGRHLTLSRFAAAAAALIFAFSPFHLAQASYHPHIAQVQWIPVYLLALLMCLDRWSLWRAIMLVSAAAAVVASNLYGGFITAVVTPFVVLSYWWTRTRGSAGVRSLLATISTLACVCLAGLGHLWRVAPAALTGGSLPTASYEDLVVHSARWWAYLVPPVANPWVGDYVSALWQRADIGGGLLEQQVSLGTGVLLLGGVAAASWFNRRRDAGAHSVIPALAAIASVALLCSLPPEGIIASVTVEQPSAWLYGIAPMFRAYARFGVVVQLMAALLAGFGLDALRQQGRPARLVGGMLLCLVAAEYLVMPARQSRDVLPTDAHRWVIDQPHAPRAIDCVRRTPETESIPWLTGGRIGVLGSAPEDCRDGNFGSWLAARKIDYVLLRRDSAQGDWFARRRLPPQLTEGPAFGDVRVLEVNGPVPEIYTDETFGFSPLETDEARAWRWMSADATWAVVNTTDTSIQAALGVELQAFHVHRQIEVRLDRAQVALLTVEPERASYRLSFPDIPPGRHIVQFRAVDPPTLVDAVLGNGDVRRLSVALGAWTWRREDRR